jgi:hypothetical protein
VTASCASGHCRQFHVYRADWTVSSITFSFDGTLHDDRPNPRPDWPFDPGKRF